MIIKEAIYGLKINKVRTGLTVLGLVIGIASVIIVLSAGNSLQQFILAQLEMFGSNFVAIEVKVPNTSHESTDNAMGQAMGITITTLSIEDMEDIIELDEIVTAYAGIMGQELVSYQSEIKKTNLLGVSHTFLDVDKAAQLEKGHFFSEQQNNSLEKVAILGYDVQAKLFGVDEPIGKKIKIGKEKFTVIGVMEKRGADLFMNMDNMIILPVQTLQKKILGVDYVSFIFGKAKSDDDANLAVLPVQQILRENHHISTDDPDKDDFAVMTMAESQDLISTIIGGITIILIAIAGISLIVGGVGIMNIMYVTVAERTYEIGLRKALGATPKNILRQFLLEAVFITLLGGIIGIIIGIGISYLISYAASILGFEWPFTISIFAIILGTAVSTIIGLVFGIYPAKKASKLDPIVALRQE